MSFSPLKMRSWRRDSGNTPSPSDRNTPSPPRTTTSSKGYLDTTLGHRAFKSDPAIADGEPLDRRNKVLDFVRPEFIPNIRIGQMLRLGFRENMPLTSIFHQQIMGNDSPEDHMCVVMAIKGDIAEVCSVTSFHNGETPLEKRGRYWQSCVWLDSGSASATPTMRPEGPRVCKDVLQLDRTYHKHAHTGHGSWVRTDHVFRIELVNLQRFNFQSELWLDYASVAIIQRQLMVWNPSWCPSPAVYPPRRWSAPGCMETTTSRRQQIMSKSSWR